MAGRFISFDVPVLSRVFGCGNKLLSWPKTNCVVYVSLTGGDYYGPKTINRGLNIIPRLPTCGSLN